MAGSAVALRSWVATTRLTAGRVTGRTVEEAGRLFALAPPLQVIRPADLLVLEFQFINLRRSGGRLIRANAGRPAYLIATHQFQSVGEEAFPEITGANQTKMEADQNLKGRKNPPQSAGVTPAGLPPQAKVRAAGSSRLVYEAPAGLDGLDWTLPSLLEACRTWPLFLDGSAQPDPGDLRYHGVVKLGWISRDLRSTVTLAREALGERLSSDGRAALDQVASELARSGLAAARDTTPNESGLLARRASAAIRQLIPASSQQEEGRVDHVAAAIYVRAQASRRALIDVQRGRVADVFDLTRLPPEIFVDFLRPDPPGEHETALEMPYRLIASPLKTAGFTHALAPVTHRGRTELWHSRMGSRLIRDGQVHIDDRPGAPTDSGGWKGEKLRFIWSPDYRKDTQDGFRKPLDKLDRQMLVKLTAGYDEKRQDGVTPFTPRAAYVRRLMLTALGGDLEAHRKFDPRPQGVDLSAWTHRAAIGRDYFVRVEYSGFLFPFGHRATLVKLTERKFQWRDPTKQNDRVAFLRQRFFIVVRDKVIDYPGGAPQPHAGRSLPFVQVACAVDVTPDLAPPGSSPGDRLPADFYSEQIEAEFRQAFWPSRGGGVDYRFPMIGTDQAGRKIAFDMPLIFMSELRNCSPHISKVAAHWNSAASAPRRVAPLGGQSVRMAPASPEAADVDVPLIDAEIRAIAPTGAIGATPAAKLQQFPRFGQSTAKLAAIERLIGQPREDKIAFYEPFLANGLGPGDLFARIVGPTKLSFGTAAPSDAVGAIATPDITPSGLSARHGVASGPLASFGANSFNPSDFFPDAKLLGFFSLKTLLKALPLGDTGDTPKITTAEIPDLKLVRTRFAITQTLDSGQALPGLITGAGGPSVFSLTTQIDTPLDGKPASTSVTGVLTHFKISLVGALILHFDRLNFRTVDGRKPDVDVDLNPETGVTFGGPLEFINRLKDFIPANGFSDPPNLDVTPAGITAGYSLGLPTVQLGILALSNISLGAAFSLPFTGGPPTARFNFAERQNTFNLTVSMFGGGGFVALVADTGGVKEIEAQLDFGAQIAINLGVASGSVYVKGGFYFHYAGDKIEFEGFVEMGGRLSVLGLVSVSMTFHLGLTYELLEKSANNGVRSSKLLGQASLVVEIEILFFSTSVSVSVEKTFIGSEADPTFLDFVPEPALWDEYCAAYA